MKKSELRTGMLIETASEELGLVMLNTPKGDIIASDNNPSPERTWGSLEKYNEDLTHEGVYSSIDKVYDYSSAVMATQLSKRNRILLWDRKRVEALQLTEKYEALLDRDSEDVLVGCQRVPFSKVLELAKMIAGGK